MSNAEQRSINYVGISIYVTRFLNHMRFQVLVHTRYSLIFFVKVFTRRRATAPAQRITSQKKKATFRFAHYHYKTTIHTSLYNYYYFILPP